MRGSGWLVAIVPLAAWLASVCYPALALCWHVLLAPHTDAEVRTPWQLMVTSIGWAAAVAAGSTLIGWLPGRWLGRTATNRRFVVVATLLLTPMCLPSYLVFFAWWQSWPADSALHQWVVANDLMAAARQSTLYVGLCCWSWPLVSWCVAGAVALAPAERDELLRLDGAGPAARLADSLRQDSGGLLLGALVVFLATLNNTTSFDLAEVFTFANELRAIEALGGSARDVMAAAAPLALLAGGSAVAVWMMTGGSSREIPARTARALPSTVAASVVILLASSLLPLGLLIANVGAGRGLWGAIGEFLALYRFSALNTVGLAAVSGALSALMALGFMAAWQDHRRWVNRLADIAGLSWLVAAVMPGTMIGVALEAAYNHGILARAIYSTQAIIVLGHLASFGFAPVLLGRWAVAGESRQLQDLRRLDGAQTFTGTVMSTWPRLLAACGASMAVVLVLSIGEIPVTAKVNPPMRAGHGPLALTLLNDMHYQRPQTVMVAAIGLMIAAIGAAAAVALAWRLLQRYK